MDRGPIYKINKYIKQTLKIHFKDHRDRMSKEKDEENSIDEFMFIFNIYLELRQKSKQKKKLSRKV